METHPGCTSRSPSAQTMLPAAWSQPLDPVAVCCGEQPSRRALTSLQPAEGEQLPARPQSQPVLEPLAGVPRGRM